MSDQRLFRIVLLLLACLSAGFTAVSVSGDPLDPYLIPWEYESIAETALLDGQMHFFFMAGEGYPVGDSSDSDIEKWGDSCLVAFPNGELMLIDSGMPKYAPILIENLRRLGVERLDYLIISHPHDDHAGAVYTDDGLPDHIGIGQAYYNGAYNANWSDPQRLEKVMAAHDIPLQAISAGFTLDIGDVRLQVISPEPDVIGQTFKTTPDINNSSIVLRMDYGDFSALFTGDIYQLQEMELVRNAADLLDADLLKMPHHGNSTSNSKKFADAVKPQLAVATGRLVIDAMQYYVYTKNGAKVLFDYCDGYIHVYTDGEEITWEHSRERTIDFYDKYEYENLMAVN
ncbi:MAG: MBL fold metallo-hydrolase [Flexilinea sp.]|nr:MBL fold metallo-hydrolase [Flexilinea sp.]